MGSIISPRLYKAADMLPCCRVLADIGCDHGKLSVSLLESGKCNKIIATDISPPSLEKAKELAKAMGFLDNIEARLGYGLDVLKEGEANAAVIAGMGGILISEILEKGKKIAQEMECLVLQPMQHAQKLRRYLRENGFRIEDEALVKEDKRIYAIMKIKAGAEYFEKEISAMAFDYIGKRLFEKKDPLLAQRMAIILRDLRIKANYGDIDIEILNEIEKLNQQIWGTACCI